MAQFKPMIITNSGMQASAQAIGEHTIKFTHVLTSDLNLSGKTDDEIRALTSIGTAKQDLEIGMVTVASDHMVSVPVDIKTASLTEDYQLYALALMATVDDEEEIIYGIVVATEPELVSAYDGKVSTDISFQLNTHVSSSSNVEIVVAPDAAITQGELSAILERYVLMDDLTDLLAKQLPDTLTKSDADEHIIGVWNFDHVQIKGKELSLGGDSGDLVLTDSDATISGTYNFTTTPTINGIDVATVDDVAKKADDNNVVHRSADTGMATDPTAFNYGDLKVGINSVSGDVDISQADYTALGSNFDPNVTYFIPEG